MNEIKVGDRFGQWLVTEVEEHGNGEDSVLIEDTKGGFGGFWIPVYFIQTLGLVPPPVEVLEFWRVTRTDPAGEEWIDDLIDRESAMREAREYLKAWKDRPGHTATITPVREIAMSPEEVKL